MIVLLAEFTVFKSESILTFDKLAAFCKVILPSSTVTIISLPLFVVECEPLICNVEFSLKPFTMSLPSPAVYSIKLSVEPAERMIVSLPAPPASVTLSP